MECLTPEVVTPIAWALGSIGVAFAIAWVAVTLIQYE